MDIYERFHALPRGRRGDKTVVIVDEDTLATLIADAQASEGALMARAAKAHRTIAEGSIQITGPILAGAAHASSYHLDRWAETDPGRP